MTKHTESNNEHSNPTSKKNANSNKSMLELKHSNAPIMSKNAEQSIQVFELNIQMNYDASKCWIKQVYPTLQQINNAQNCSFEHMNIHIQHSNEPMMPEIMILTYECTNPMLEWTYDSPKCCIKHINV